jgi:outer membrane receptor for ferrienterochelin and colicin
LGKTQAFVTVSTNGARQNQVSFRLDGANNNDLYTNVNQPFPFPDALQEFSVQTSNYSAKYGGNAGGVVNVVTKGGTNDFHGNLFEFNRNAVLNARNFFAAKRDQLKRNQPVAVQEIASGRLPEAQNSRAASAGTASERPQMIESRVRMPGWTSRLKEPICGLS